jgi:hypothetical protein
MLDSIREEHVPSLFPKITLTSALSLGHNKVSDEFFSSPKVKGLRNETPALRVGRWRCYGPDLFITLIGVNSAMRQGFRTEINLIEYHWHVVIRCEVSERATHRSSPHGPCKPTAQLTGQAQTYTMDLPKQDSMLPEAASERDQCSPHIHTVSPAIRARSCTIATQMRPVPHDPELSTPSYDATLRICTSNERDRCSPYHTDGARHYSAPSNRIRPVPSRGVWTTSPLFHSQTTGRTHHVPDADPSDEAEDIPTQPIPHFTRRID